LLRHTDVPTRMSSHSVCRSTDAPGEVLAALRVARRGYARLRLSRMQIASVASQGSRNTGNERTN
jgi:hypothetical protein